MDVGASDEIQTTTLLPESVSASAWFSGARLAPPPQHGGALTEPHACVASQWGGFMYVRGDEDDLITVAIRGCTITNCSAVAEGPWAVRTWHARFSFPGVLERERVGGQGLRCRCGCRTAWRAHAAQPIDACMIRHECANAFILSRLCEI